MSSENDSSVYDDAVDKMNDDMGDVLARIEENLCSEDDTVKDAALIEFKTLVHSYDEDLPINFYNLAKGPSREILTSILVERLQFQITKYINDNPLKLISIIPIVRTEIDNESVVDVLMETVDSLSDEIIKKFLCDFVIPAMYYPSHKNEEIHNVIIDFGFKLIRRFPITKFSSQEVKLMISKLMEQHIQVLEKWREENFKRWHDLWIFLVRFFATNLHGAMDLANKLLRIVEYAFRNSSSEQRVKGYECWKEMIDNASLNMKHMTSTKQIKLLVTPLRAKFSKLEVVIGKRFEVFLYLLQKLQGYSVLCLIEFFEFCFGVSNTNYLPKNGQMKFVPSLCLKCIEVVLAILGNQTHIFKEFEGKIFKKEILDASNIERFNPVIVYAVIESSSLVKLVPMNMLEKLKLLELLWTSLFNILKKSSIPAQEKVFESIFNSFSILFKDYNEDVIYVSLFYAFAELLESNVDYNLYKDAFKSAVEHFIQYLNDGIFLDDLLDPFDETLTTVCKKKHTYEFLIEQLKKVEPTKNEVIALKLWSTLKTHIPEKDTKSIVCVLLWPVFHLHKCVDIAKNVSTKWSELFSQISDANKILILNEMDKAFKSNPLLSSNISTIISFLVQDNLNLGNDTGKSLLKVMANIVSLPLLSEETTEKMLPMILKCSNVIVIDNEADLESVEHICQCLQKIPAHKKNSSLSVTMEGLLKKLGAYTNTNSVKMLKNLLSTFPSPKSNKKSSKLHNMLSPDGSTTPNSNIKRSIRMTQMVFDKDGSFNNRDRVEALQLFGKDIDTRTPLKVKGSILQNTPSPSSSRSKRIVNSVKKPQLPEPPIYDEQTCEFAVIDTEVKLQKNMLTDHQKEKLRQRREDIPALYQDLSQSQTQNSLSTDTQSNQPTIVDKNENEEISIKGPEDESMECQKLEMTMEDKVLNRTVETLKKQDDNDSNTDSNDESGNKKTKKLAKSDRELLRIQMDIVGGNSFIQNLPSKRPRKVNEKVNTLTPKRSKKTEADTPSNNKTQSTPKTETPTVVLEQINVPDAMQAVEVEKSEENVQTPVQLSKSEKNQVSGESSSQNHLTPNRRKNKLMKPIKNFDSPSSEKKKNKQEKKEVLSVKKKEKHEKTNRKRKSLSTSENPESEPLFESEIIPEVKGESLDNAQQTSKKSENSQVVKEPKTDGVKPKKSSKELMKKNKEKVKTIQSQLKLADLSNFEVSSEKSKPKNAKLIFIRELTNPKNPQDTKVSPAGLKRNKDNKSKNIAYTIETPTTSVDISTLVNIDEGCIPSFSKAVCNDSTSEIVKTKKKRKRPHSESSYSTDSNSPEYHKKNLKVHNVKESPVENVVSEMKERVEGVEDNTKKVLDNTSIPKRRRSLKVEKVHSPSSESSLFSPGSPSRSTRSRTNSPMNTSTSPLRQVSPRGVRTLFKDSEDIIESSQGSLLENSLMSIGNLSRSRIRQSPKAQNVSSKSEDVEKVKTSPIVSLESSATEGSPKTKPISQATTLTCESNFEAQPAVVQVEVPVKQELSDSEKLLSMADTVSIESEVTETDKEDIKITEECMDGPDIRKIEDDAERCVSPVQNEIQIEEILSTPEKNKDNLPGSPVSQATPTYKQEFLDSTLDISPIGSQVLDPEEKSTSDILAALDAELGEPIVSEPSGSSKSSADINTNSIVLSTNQRSKKLLNMVNVESPVSSQKKASRKKLASPALRKTRYEKLFSFYRKPENGDSVTLEEGKKICQENEGDMLTFSREVPSPLAVPSSSILKRKLADTDDTYSPCPKRKRVHFNYPCITSTKLFIRHKDELNTHFRPTFATNLFDEEPEVAENEDEDPFADPETFTQTGSEESMEITNSLLLCSNKPVDERLINCEDNLDPLWKRLSSPTYCDKLKNLLISKNIETIGDLASLKEVEINRLPFRDPKVRTVRKALFHYYTNVFNKPKEDEEQVSENSSTGSEEDKEKRLGLENGDHEPAVTEMNVENGEEEDSEPRPENLKEELRLVLTKIKEKKTSLEEFGEVLIDLVEESDLISILENVYNTNFRKFFGKPHWRYLVENIVKSGGTSELFDIISDLAEHNKVFADQLEHIVQVRIDQDPLKNILKKKTLVQVCSALQDCISDGEFERENVLQMCLMPMIKTPSDIRNYFNSLTIVQIHDLFIERVQPSDLTCFLDQIREHYGNYTIAQCANKKDVLKICSKEEVAVALIEKENEVGAVKHIVSLISDEDKLLELYNYIGSLLPIKSRVKSHIELLQSISFDKDQVE